MSQCLSESVSEFPWVTPFTFIEEYLKSPKGKLNFILIVKFVLISFILNSFRNLLSSVVCSWRNNAKLPKCLSTGLVFAPSRVPTPVRVTHHPPAYGCQPASSNGSWRCSIPPPSISFFLFALCLASRHHPLCCDFVFKNSSSLCQNQGCFHTPSQKV